MYKLVSICLPVLNGGPFLEQRMESIRVQELEDWELIVCDSFSDDGSWEYLNKFKDDNRVRLFRVPREGVYSGWNECLRRVNGKYIHVATADDTITPDFLSSLTAELEKRPGTDIAVSQFDFIDAEGSVLDPPPRRRLDEIYGDWLKVPHLRPRETEILIHLCLGGIPWMTAGAMIFRKSLLEKAGFFRTDLGPRADMMWSLKASLHSGTISLPETMATFRQHAEQASSRHVPGWEKRNLEGKADILGECEEQIPADWRKHKNWRDRLLWKARMDYQSGFNLSRRVMRRTPGGFVKGAMNAALVEPGYLVKRMMQGFSWDSEEFGDEYEYFWTLVNEWGVEWEPARVSD